MNTYITSYKDIDNLWYCGGNIYASTRKDAVEILADIISSLRKYGIDLDEIRIDGVYAMSIDCEVEFEFEQNDRNDFIASMFYYKQMETIVNNNLIANIIEFSDNIIKIFEKYELYEKCAKIQKMKDYALRRVHTTVA